MFFQNFRFKKPLNILKISTRLYLPLIQASCLSSKLISNLDPNDGILVLQGFFSQVCRLSVAPLQQQRLLVPGPLQLVAKGSQHMGPGHGSLERSSQNDELMSIPS